MYTTLTINGENYSKFLILPYKINRLLDERLDEARLSLRHVPVDIFEMGVPVTLSVDLNGETKEFQFLMSADEAEEVPVGSGRYNHEIALIELTKELENYVMPTLKFTNSLGRTYTDDPTKVEPVYE